jgi:uncharacterized lipoprotein YehR (DUF1307 family)
MKTCWKIQGWSKIPQKRYFSLVNEFASKEEAEKMLPAVQADFKEIVETLTDEDAQKYLEGIGPFI